MIKRHVWASVGFIWPGWVKVTVCSQIKPGFISAWKPCLNKTVHSRAHTSAKARQWSSERSLMLLFLCQEDSRRSQEMPEGVRHRAQRPVVHGVPLEESLPTLPRLKHTKQLRDGESERDGEVDGWMSDKRDFYQSEDLNQGPSAVTRKQLFSYMFVFLLSTCFFLVSFLKKYKLIFFCIFVTSLQTEAGLTSTMWCAKPTILSHVIQRPCCCPL